MNTTILHSPTRYTTTAISLHWLIALALFGSFALGIYMHELPLSPQKLKYYSWHKWAGVSIFLFVLVRLAWHHMNHPPAMPDTMPGWQKFAAEATHVLLYILMLAIPISGWLMSSAKGFQTVWFGVLPLPDLLAKNEGLGNLLQGLHKVLNFTMAGLVLAHLGATLKHHLIDRDDILTRMIPFLSKPDSGTSR